MDESFLEADPILLGNEDSSYESTGYNTSTASLSSSINEYIYENGRKYHAYYGHDKNLNPTDEKEQERLDIHHEVFLLLLNRELHKAPISNPHRILDIGTGTGIWAIDMAENYPMSEVIGTDLSPIQPLWVPPNCRFELDDAEQPFTFTPESFDFIHIRNLAYGISNWPNFMAQVFQTTKPGGYVEISDVGLKPGCDDGTMTDDNGVKIFMEQLTIAMKKLGRPGATAASIRKHLEDAGFVDIKVFDFKQPLAPWPKNKVLKQVGALALLATPEGYHAYGMVAFRKALGMTFEEADRVCNESVKAAYNKNEHIYSYYHLAYGRKPEK